MGAHIRSVSHKRRSPRPGRPPGRCCKRNLYRAALAAVGRAISCEQSDARMPVPPLSPVKVGYPDACQLALPRPYGSSDVECTGRPRALEAQYHSTMPVRTVVYDHLGPAACSLFSPDEALAGACGSRPGNTDVTRVPKIEVPARGSAVSPNARSRSPNRAGGPAVGPEQ
jgi:hypothetical protein